MNDCNSIPELLTHAVPLIRCPMIIDQFLNAKFLIKQIDVCMKMARGTIPDIIYVDIIEKIELFMGL